MWGTLYKLLHQLGKPYNKCQYVSERVKIVGRIYIEQRPAIADLKQEPAHFKIDIIFERDKKSFLLKVFDQ